MRLVLALLWAGTAAADPFPMPEPSASEKPNAKSAAEPKPAEPNASTRAKRAAKPTKADKPERVVVPHIQGMSEAQRGVEITPSIDYWNNPANTVTKAPSFGGGTSLGMVQRPPWHNDMRPYSEGGMVIRPPDTGDDMIIGQGTSWLTGGTPLRRFWKLLEYGANKMLETLIPSGGKT